MISYPLVISIGLTVAIVAHLIATRNKVVPSRISEAWTEKTSTTDQFETGMRDWMDRHGITLSRIDRPDGRTTVQLHFASMRRGELLLVGFSLLGAIILHYWRLWTRGAE